MAKKKLQIRKKQTGCPRHVLRLYLAVANYLEKCGGKAVLSSGVQIIQWPSDRPGQFTVGVKVLGRKPTYSDGTDAAPDKDKEGK